MFYKMIQAKRDQWFQSAKCTVGALVEYMESNGHLRDAQIDAIKTYLFLKIGCACKPLWQLFAAGTFNTCDLDAAELSSAVRTFLLGNPAAAALYEYACQKNDAGDRSRKALKMQSKSRQTVSTILPFSRGSFMMYPTRIICSAFRWAQVKPI